MFKDNKQGQTHFQNDGCGEPRHNNWEEEFDNLEWPMHLAGTGVDMEMYKRDEQVKDFIRKNFIPRSIVEEMRKEKPIEGKDNMYEDVGVLRKDLGDNYRNGYNQAIQEFNTKIDKRIEDLKSG